MKYWIGIEGGGTHSTVVCVDNNLNTLKEWDGPALQAKRVPLDLLADRVHNILKKVLEYFDGDLPQSIGLAFSGAARMQEQVNIKEAIKPYTGEIPVFMTSDVRAAHAGSFNNMDGILVIAGTGSIVLGRKGERWERAGGYGFLLGDEGSGHAIGAEGLRRAGSFFDGETSTLLLDELNKELNIKSRDDLIQWVYDQDHSPSEIAPLVLVAAEHNDAVCQEIVNQQLDELIHQVSLVANKLDFAGPEIITHGGLFNNSYYSRKFNKKLESNLPAHIIKTPQYNAAVGVCIMMKDQRGVTNN